MDNLWTPQTLMSNKIEEMTKVLMKKLDNTNLSEEERSAIISDTINSYFLTATSHSFTKRKLSKSSALIADDLDTTFEEIEMDLSVLYKEMANITDGILKNFNYAASQKRSLLSSIKELGSTIKEYGLITQGTTKNSIILSDNFNTENNIDKDFGSGSKAFVHVSTGIVTLEHKDSVNISSSGTIHNIVGNGTPGNYHTILSDNVSDLSNIVSSNSLFLSEKDAHDKEEKVLDKLPSTWYEYQMIGMDDAQIALHSRYTDLSWVKSKKIGDKLRMKMTIKLNSLQSINWININPYMPSGSSSKLIIHSISTSPDGLIYSPIYNGGLVLNSELNTFPNTYDPNYVASDSLANSKFTNQGVWNFPARDVQYIEIVIDQNESYQVKVGIPVYMRVIQKTSRRSTTETKTRIPEKEVPIEIQNAAAGKYKISTTDYIEKTIEEVDAWRYCIGIKDINIYKYIFAKQSELISKLYEFEKPVKTVTLSVKEIIPQSMIKDIKTRNNWIKYYISINDVEWYEISPSSHYKIGDTDIAPKVYTINRIQNTSNINSGSIVSKDEVKQIRLKAVISRGNNESDTPILEDYNLNISIEE
jgi:hypothetical protein